MGWDRRSVRLKVLDTGRWHTYLLPKAAYCNDASHGWYTEWPRIREITEGRWMMDMHGMFYDFPSTFTAANSAGIKPIGSHLRYVPDFCQWNGRLVLASDETSIQGNPLAGQPQSNLWFGEYDDLKNWGPASGYGGPWIEDVVKASVPSDPFLVAGFDRRILHLSVGRKKSFPMKPFPMKAMRATDQQRITSLPDQLAALPRVSIDRGSWHQPAPGFSFHVNTPVTVYLSVDRRGDPQLPPSWKLTKMSLLWGKGFRDRVYSREFSAGTVAVPGNDTEHTPGSYGMPHLALVSADQRSKLRISQAGTAAVSTKSELPSTETSDEPVLFTIEVDTKGTGTWDLFRRISVPSDGNVSLALPDNFNATWMRFKTDRDCTATAILHQTTARFVDGVSPANAQLFAGIADVEDADVIDARLYAAKRNRNLRVVNAAKDSYEFTKHGFEFTADEKDTQLAELLDADPEFTVDAASVVLTSAGKTYRLPKGHAAYNQPFASGWPRSSREVESERHLANIHGTFYEIPLITNGAPPAWNRMRPVSSHRKQITDFCSWNGLLVLAGIKSDAAKDGHVFRDPTLGQALWFGGIDDLWKFGKPVGLGGPWLNTAVKPGEPSDPYLMTGYDRKVAELSHDSADTATITLQIDIDGEGHWVEYDSFDVPVGAGTKHEFPEAFSAHWIRAICDKETNASVQFEYQ